MCGARLLINLIFSSLCPFIHIYPGTGIREKNGQGYPWRGWQSLLPVFIHPGMQIRETECPKNIDGGEGGGGGRGDEGKRRRDHKYLPRSKSQIKSANKSTTADSCFRSKRAVSFRTARARMRLPFISEEYRRRGFLPRKVTLRRDETWFRVGQAEGTSTRCVDRVCSKKRASSRGKRSENALTCLAGLPSRERGIFNHPAGRKGYRSDLVLRLCDEEHADC